MEGLQYRKEMQKNIKANYEFSRRVPEEAIKYFKNQPAVQSELIEDLPKKVT